MAFLLHARADLDEAEEITEWIWADCIMERAERRPRLATYRGNASLKTWLHAVALNRLIARRQVRTQKEKLFEPGFDIENLDGGGAGLTAMVPEAPLLDLMREALEAGFQACAAEDFVLLQLAHMDRLRLIELARMFGCSTSKIDRDLARAGKVVAAATLGHVRKVDPLLDLQWEDFVDLCRVATPSCFGVD